MVKINPGHPPFQRPAIADWTSLQHILVVSKLDNYQVGATSKCKDGTKKEYEPQITNSREYSVADTFLLFEVLKHPDGGK